ncbi:expressed unknown protein [Seminavis robusta]|uniref:Uncharacterized protein n=1 Tax=Seminavis robusta TaxID=568900 RepID=A0A9N8DFK2_9STRA|nr:expressed unknown protein [Seminavis robusta]|eukprot:Sro133_g063070.1 n/a (249) ;mRNA; f:65736-66482
MVPFVTPPTRVLMQGGFWVVRPNRTIFNDIVDMILHHGDHFSLNCGWGPCDLGSARFYGGAGFQGIISYYYGYFYRLRNGSFKSKKRNKKSKNNDKSNTFMNIPPDPHPNLVELNRCLYNSMADRARKACATNTKDQMACNHCNDTDLKDLYGAHFTLCQKPWNCGPHHNEPLCYRFHHAWHVIRADFVQQQQGTNRTVVLDDPPPDPSINHKTKKKRRNRWAQHIVQKFPSQCQSLGPEGYVPMGLL